MPIEFDGPNSKVSADTIAGQGGSTITIQSGHSLSGSGSGLTALNATQLTSGTLPMARLSGTLPALNGSALTNLPAHSGNVAFPASQSASSNANTLDDYEEGTWTPQLTDGTNTNATAAGNNLGEYIKVGRAVFISCTVSTTAIGSLSGQIWCDGLPFTVKGGNLGFAVMAGSGGGMGLSAGHNMSGNFNGNTTKIAIYTWDVSTGTSGMQASEWGGGNTQMTFAGHYFTAS